ncbi:hypothetical protein HCC30_04620 [Streptomyces sp. HNM0574]|nr:hypothetical protein [Streptomyces sp. HNM0574]
MTRGGFVQLPDGSVIVALTIPRPYAEVAGATGPTPGRMTSGIGRGLFPGPDRPRPARSRRAEEAYAPRRWSAHADEAHTVRAAGACRRGADEPPRVRVLVHALNRARALTRIRNLGLRSVYLNGNTEPPTADEVTAVLHHPEGLVWRAVPLDDRESWRPIAALLHPGGPRARTA